MLLSRADIRWLALTPDGLAVRLPDGTLLMRQAAVGLGGGGEISSALAAAYPGGRMAIRDRPIGCVCSDAYARYAVVPWDPNVHRRADEEVLARFALEPVLGDRPESWEIRLGPASFGSSRLACAMPRDLLDTVREEMLKAGQRRGRVVPLLSMVIDRWAPRIGEQDAVLLAIVPGHVVAVAWVGGQYAWVRVFSGDLSALPALVRRAHLIHGGENVPRCFATVLGGALPAGVDMLRSSDTDFEYFDGFDSVATALVHVAEGGGDAATGF